MKLRLTYNRHIIWNLHCANILNNLLNRIGLRLKHPKKRNVLFGINEMLMIIENLIEVDTECDINIHQLFSCITL